MSAIVATEADTKKNASRASSPKSVIVHDSQFTPRSQDAQKDFLAFTPSSSHAKYAPRHYSYAPIISKKALLSYQTPTNSNFQRSSKRIPLQNTKLSTKPTTNPNKLQHINTHDFTDALTTTIKYPFASSVVTSSTFKNTVQSPFIITHFAGLTHVPKKIFRDRNTYNLDGTRSHPAHPVPSSPLDNLVDDILMPVVDYSVDNNTYNLFDGTRVHPPRVPEAVEFAREFAMFDRMRHRQQHLKEQQQRLRGPRLNPFARPFVPSGAVSATTAASFAQIDARNESRKRTHSVGPADITLTDAIRQLKMPISANSFIVGTTAGTGTSLKTEAFKATKSWGDFSY
ncbi:hypothetical protein HK100_012830 [Physocladia obscura]|uniref:Uncharacterized protein n=1 Tax=Physocladia obscura TaxID=109957 RepID=A0AAD5SZ86_9FUNG|nr:hypothetical protein HK100_012830 [Physocladia obscura]